MDTCIGGGMDEWMDKMNYGFPHVSPQGCMGIKSWDPYLVCFSCLLTMVPGKELSFGVLAILFWDTDQSQLGMIERI